MKKNKIIILVKVFFILGLISDILYPIVSSMGSLRLSYSPGELIRGFEILILIGLVLNNRIKIKGHEIIILLIFFFVSLFYLVFPESENEFALRFAWFIKVVFLVIFYRLFLQLFKDNSIEAKKLVKFIILSSLIVIVIPIYLAKANIIGYNTYDINSGREGFKGLMYAQNSTSIQLISILPLSIIYISNPIFLLMIISSGLLLGTKGGLMASLVTTGFLLISLHKNKFIHSINRLVIILSIIIGFSFFINYFISITLSNLALYEGFYLRNDSFLMMATTGRWEYFSTLPKLLAEINIIELFLGTPTPIYNEIDITAIFTRFGLLGVVTYLVFFSQQTKKAIRNVFDNNFSMAISISTILILLHSIFGGHVLGNAVVAINVALIFALNSHLNTKNIFSDKRDNI